NSTERTENSTEGGAENNRVIKAEVLGVEYESPGEMVHSLEKASGIKHWSEAYQSIKTAVKKTEGRCLTFAKNRAADVMWHRISPGMTRYYKGNLTGKSDGISVCCPELKSMDAQDKMLPEAVNTVIYDRRLLAELLWEIPGTEQILEESQPLSSFFQVEKRDKTGYIEEITVGNRKMTGEEAAALLKVASGCFYVSDLGSGIKLLVYGDGTGYGMSLAGADEMAGKGADYQEILEYYFPVCKIE
ncbi:MAG: hypothetical protein Q4F21_13920, partial [Lachnospiraceae bacterium]|nr:hypothetical protein [Lachnospiraceae bacterium]